jgi:hypothetical protein
MMIEGNKKVWESSDPIGLKKKEKIFRPTHNPILLNIENNYPFLPFSSVLSNSHKTYQTLLHIITKHTQNPKTLLHI